MSAAEEEKQVAEGEEEEEEDLEKLEAEIARMEAEAARINKETEEIEKKKEAGESGTAKLSGDGSKAAQDAYVVFCGEMQKEWIDACPMNHRTGTTRPRVSIDRGSFVSIFLAFLFFFCVLILQ